MKRVLFFAPFGQYAVHHQLDAVLAAALRARGCDVQAIGCDGIFSTCDILAWAGTQAAKVCQECSARSKQLFGMFQLPLRQLREFLSPADFKRVREWALNLDVTSYATATFEGRPIGEWATSSVFSHFRITSASLHRPEVRAVHQGYLENALLTYLALSRMVEEFPPDAMVVFNGRMSPYRVAFEVAREKGIRVLGHERGVTPGSFTLYENAACTEPQSIFHFIEQWRQVPLGPAEFERCSTMTRRQSGAHMNYPGFYDFLTEAAEVRHTLDIPTSARVLGVFTSSEFELANNASYQSVTSQLDYIDRLIEVFRSRPDYLVVRHHPNIAGDATIMGDHDFLRRAWHQAQQAPANVRIVMPSEKFSSYGLIPHLSGAIAFFSSTGQESIARGVAAAALPQSYSHQAATFIIDDTSRDGLAGLVDRLFAKTESFAADDLRPCYRFLAASLSRHSSKFDSFEIKDFFSADIRVQTDEELMPGTDAALDRACDFLLTGASMFTPPSAADLHRSTADEEAFFASEMQRLREHNWRQFPSEQLPACAASSIPVSIIKAGNPGKPPAWWLRARHRALVDGGHVATGESFIRDLRSRLASVSERYVLIANDDCSYDESFLRTAVQTLEGDEKLSGFRIGAWVARSDGTIEGEIFTPRHPCRDFFAACEELPTFHRPETALSFALFRTRHLIEILDSLPSDASPEQAAMHVFTALRHESMHERLAPMAMIRPQASTISGALDTTSTPVLFMIFNRPDLTQQVFEAIRAQRPRQLFIAADGPRRQVAGERERCEATRRRVMDRIDWDCEVKTLFRSENLGCKHAVAGAISWFFEHVEEGIILEDDCLPEPDFFRFCTELLHRYRDASSVMMIGGVNFQQGRQRGPGSYYFSKHTHIWGWATWRRAWQLYDLRMGALDEFLASPAWKQLCPQPAEAAYWEPIMQRVRDGLIDTWDYQWTYSAWKHGGLAALPQVNLVTNLGFRSDATHTTEAGARLANLRTKVLEKLDFIDAVERDEAADDFTFETIFKSPATKPAKKPSKAKKLTKGEERQSHELASLKGSLAWRLIGKHLHSVEKRIRRPKP